MFKRKKRILLAEDDGNIRTIVKFTLEGRGHEVTDVADGTSALDLAQKGKFDLVVLDVMMPGKNGLEVCYAIKNNPKLEHVPVLILTATTQASTKSDDYWRVRARADDFITKPFKSADLVQRVETLLQGTGREEGDGQARYRI